MDMKLVESKGSLWRLQVVGHGEEVVVELGYHHLLHL